PEPRCRESRPFLFPLRHGTARAANPWPAKELSASASGSAGSGPRSTWRGCAGAAVALGRVGVGTRWLDIRASTFDGLARLSPAFRSDAVAARFTQIHWRVTAGNSSQITDGAAAVLITSAERAAQLGLQPRARIHAMVIERLPEVSR